MKAGEYRRWYAFQADPKYRLRHYVCQNSEHEASLESIEAYVTQYKYKGPGIGLQMYHISLFSLENIASSS